VARGDVARIRIEPDVILNDALMNPLGWNAPGVVDT
jgi:hypothetical protein